MFASLRQLPASSPLEMPGRATDIAAGVGRVLNMDEPPDAADGENLFSSDGYGRASSSSAQLFPWK